MILFLLSQFLVLGIQAFREELEFRLALGLALYGT